MFSSIFPVRPTNDLYILQDILVCFFRIQKVSLDKRDQVSHGEKIKGVNIFFQWEIKKRKSDQI